MPVKIKCKRCGELRRYSGFYKAPDCKDGRRPVCKICIREQQKETYARNRKNRQQKQREWGAANRDYQRENNLRKKYNIGVVEYEQMFVSQGGKCGVCGLPEIVCDKAGKLKRLAVDHNHETGKIRGLLCQKCNQALGLLDENPVIIRSLADYIA